MDIRSKPSAELGSVRQRLAGVLLQQARTNAAAGPGFSQSEMAAALDTSGDMVNKSLAFLQSEGAIRIERHRMFINREALERIASVEA